MFEGATLLAKAPPDDFGIVIEGEMPLSRSDAYVWGLTKAGPNLWFGTVANTMCYAQQDVLGYAVPIEFPKENFTGYWRCEFGSMTPEITLPDNYVGPATEPLPARYGDWRPPHIYRYDTAWVKGALEEITPSSIPMPSGRLFLMDPSPLAFPEAEWLRNVAIGFRSAGTVRDVVFLAGPSVDNSGIVVFAYAADGKFLGAKQLPEYSNVRSWVTYNDELYVGVALTDPVDGNSGAVLRWTGFVDNSESPTPGNLFAFETVGYLENEAANLAIHKDRIYATTWPLWTSPDPTQWKGTSLYRSPEFAANEGVLTNDNADEWTKLWNIAQYDPDFVAAVASGGGALESFGDSIYWGTMHVPFSAGLLALYLSTDLGPALQENMLPINENTIARVLNMMLGSHRSPALFRGRDVVGRRGATTFQVSLIYGEKYLPKAKLQTAGGDGVYRIAPTTEYATRSMPLHGASGFGNFFNAYIWSAAKWPGFSSEPASSVSEMPPGYGDRLWLGTFDWSQPFRAGLQGITNTLPDPNSSFNQLMHYVAQGLLSMTGSIVPHEGADLYRLELTFDPLKGELPTQAVAESLSGLGNDTNYGFRTMVFGEAPKESLGTAAYAPPPSLGRLYIGTANAMNLNPRGGWELLQLPPSPKPPGCSPESCDDKDPCTGHTCNESGVCVTSEPLSCDPGYACYLHEGTPGCAKSCRVGYPEDCPPVGDIQYGCLDGVCLEVQ